MKGILLLSSVLLSALLMSCTSQKSAAASYKEKLTAGATGEGDSTQAGDEATGDEATGDEATGDETTGDTATGDETTDGTGDAATGNVAAGQALLKNCTPCHVPGGLAKAVTLDSTAVARLDAAYTGVNKANHNPGLSAAFVDGRADLEAALKAVK